MATTWDLQRMRSVIRKITGKFDPSQMTDAEIDNYINDFYLYDFPEDMRTLKLEQWYEFTTTPNIDVYPLPDNYIQIKPPIYIDGYEAAWYQEPQLFYRIWPQLSTIQNEVAVGNGGSIYGFTLYATPILRGTLNVFAANDQENFTDDSNGNLISSVTGLAAGTIDYLTGVVTSLTFNSPVQPGMFINAHFFAYVASRPRDILFFNQEMTMRPVPQTVFSVKVVVYVQPTTALGQSQFGGNLTDQPLFAEWWQLLTYGASLKIFIEDSDHDQYDQYLEYYERQKLLAQRRALKILMNKRILTPYSGGQGGAGLPVYPIY